MAPPSSHQPTHLPSSALTSLSSFADSVNKTIATLGADLAASQKLILSLQGVVKELKDSRLSQQLQMDALVAEQHRLKERLAAIERPQAEDGVQAGRGERRRSDAAPKEVVRLPEVRNGVGRPGAEGKRELLLKRKAPGIVVTADSDGNSSGQEEAAPAAPPARKRRTTAAGPKRDKGPGQASAW